MRHLPGVVFMKNRRGQYVSYDEAAQGLFGSRPDDFLGKTDPDVWPAESPSDLSPVTPSCSALRNCGRLSPKFLT